MLCPDSWAAGNILPTELYNEQHQMCVAEVAPPLSLALTPSQEKMAYHFSEQLVAIGIHLQYREGQLVTRTLPCVLMERGDGEKRKSSPAVTTSVVQVSGQLPNVTCPSPSLPPSPPYRGWCPPISRLPPYTPILFMYCSACYVQLLQNTGGGGVAGVPSSLAAVLHSLACHGNRIL